MKKLKKFSAYGAAFAVIVLAVVFVLAACLFDDATAPTVITLKDIEGVTVPVIGETPVNAITATEQYTGTVRWMPNDPVFAVDTPYTATISLTPKAGYTLRGVEKDSFTVIGATSVKNYANSGVVLATFPALTVPVFTTITELGDFLAAQSINTPSAPYVVKLNVSDLTGIQAALNDVAVAGRYVSIDLSGSTLTAIPDNAFNTGAPLWAGCDTLAGIILPNGITSIGVSAFDTCTHLANITLPDSLETIGNWAFYDCESLISITIPANVANLGVVIFGGNSISAINVAAANVNFSSFDGILYNKLQTTLVMCPGGKTTVTNMPSNVQTIEEFAFSDGNLTSITIPNTVDFIKDSAFDFCKNLISVTFEGTISSSNFAADAFGDAGDPAGYIGDLREKYLDLTEGGIGTYTRESGGLIWTKQL